MESRAIGKFKEIFEGAKTALLKRYCPGYEEGMPEDAPGRYRASALASRGASLHTVSEKVVEGYASAYREARWLALKAQFFRPRPFFDCGIHYAVGFREEAAEDGKNESVGESSNVVPFKSPKR